MTALAEWRYGGPLSDEAPMDTTTSDFVRAGTLEELKAKGRLVVHGRHRPVLLVYENGTGGSQYLFAARSLIWLKKNRTTIELIFEGQGKMRSRLFQAREKAEFEKASRAIHKSVR